MSFSRAVKSSLAFAILGALAGCQAQESTTPIPEEGSGAVTPVNPRGIGGTGVGQGSGSASPSPASLARGPAPTLSSVNPSAGVGFQPITLNGSGFDPDSKVLVGGLSCLAPAVTANTITCVIPFRDAVGAVSISVISAARETVTRSDLFIHLGSPDVWMNADTMKAARLPSSAPILEWPDLSGNGNDALQKIAARQPRLSDSAVNGKPGVKFAMPGPEGSYLDLQSEIRVKALFLAQANSRASRKPDPRTLVGGKTSSQVLYEDSEQDASFSFRSVHPGDRIVHFKDKSFGTVNSIVADSPGNGQGRIRLRIDGQEVSSLIPCHQIESAVPLTGTGAGSGTGSEFTGACDWSMQFGRVGGSNESRQYDGAISELLFYGRPLKEKEIKTVEDYLRSKFIPSLP